MAQTEDAPYLVSDHAVADEDNSDEEDQSFVNDETIKEISTYLDQAIDEHNSFDVIDLNEPGKMTPTQQIAVHKVVVQHLRNIKQTINNKVKEQ